MDNVDIPALAERISEHRFTGYTDNMLADEIDRFRSGAGPGGISAAVDALKAVAEALTETERTLRTELGKLGVEWRSDAAEIAKAVFSGKADFSSEATEQVNDSAERIFAQGEAFNRTLHKLPDSQTLREGAGGYGMWDSMASLLGFETDNTRRVQAAREARQQAVQALDDYARDSGQNLLGIQGLDSPQAVHADTGPRLPGSVDAGGGPGDVTTAAGATDAPATSAPQPGPAPAARPQAAPAGGVGYHAATPALGLPAQQPPVRSTGSAFPASPAFPATSTPPQATAPSSASTVPAASAGGITGIAGAGRQAQQPPPGTSPSPGAGGGTATPAVPGTGGTGGTGGTIGAPGSGSVERPPGGAAGSGRAPLPGGAVPGKAGGLPGAVPGATPGVPGATPPPTAGLVGGKPAAPGSGGGVSDEQQLARGKSFGAAPQPASPATGGGGTSGFGAAPKAGASLNDLGAGAAAVGAGGVAGALSGDSERKGRGVGRSAPGAARSPHQLAMGDLPEEEARAQRNSQRLAPGTEPRRGGYLEKASGQDGDEDDHVRRFGVEDNDLFTDRRMVTPDVIGDDDADGRR